LPIILLSLGNLRIQLEHNSAHPFILLDERQIPKCKTEQPGNAKKEYDDSTQLAPNA
jgi:hypothetical protein